jgi:assimilatory nitrate reductase catalytic subunit
LVARQWAANLLGEEAITAAQILPGRPGVDTPDPGRIVCSCNNVGINTIVASIERGCSSVDAVGLETTAGTNCGSCRAELGALLALHGLKAAE